ncbi:galactitol-1-phosphate 5-dehydrogenase (plasmid) [Fusobacteria bacterium ZRK30]|nr:galactitol-1-phosphate 5-dehydrogenase [Fusobacteria bacterium ZRK30]
MKALVLHAKEDLRYEEIATPIINSDEVLIKVRATGICGSDFPRVLGGESRYFPNILGHEFSGEIAEIGDKVTHLVSGDKVTGAPLKPCMECDDCLSGNHAQCKHYSFIGSREFGTFAEYVKMPARNVVKLPEGCSFVQGAFIEPITVALHGLFLADFKGASSVAIVGAGTIGLLALQCAKAMGAKTITAFDISEANLEKAKKLGADYIVNTSSKDMRKQIKEITKGKGFEYVIESAGVQFTEILSLEIAGVKGNVMYIGTPHSEIKLQQNEFEFINRKELLVRGSWMSYSNPWPGKEWTIAGDYLSTGKINVDLLADRIVPMEEGVQAFKDIKARIVNGKVILTNER